MATATVVIDCTLGAEDYEDILDTAGYVIGYWAAEASIELRTEDGDEVIYRVKDGETGMEHVLDKAKIEQTIAEIIMDNRWASEPLKNAILNEDYGDIDGDLADTIIQTACFGEVIYG